MLIVKLFAINSIFRVCIFKYICNDFKAQKKKSGHKTGEKGKILNRPYILINFPKSHCKTSTPQFTLPETKAHKLLAKSSWINVWFGFFLLIFF